MRLFLFVFVTLISVRLQAMEPLNSPDCFAGSSPDATDVVVLWLEDEAALKDIDSCKWQARLDIAKSFDDVYSENGSLSLESEVVSLMDLHIKFMELVANVQSSSLYFVDADGVSQVCDINLHPKLSNTPVNLLVQSRIEALQDTETKYEPKVRALREITKYIGVNCNIPTS